jgi:hypothetical protein
MVQVSAGASALGYDNGSAALFDHAETTRAKLCLQTAKHTIR